MTYAQATGSSAETPKISASKTQENTPGKKQQHCTTEIQTQKYSENRIEESLRLNIPLKAAEEIEEATEIFTHVLQNAVWSATPEDKPQTKDPEY